ncbi:unnamed protein product [Adineta steineri]|uniref:EF-hand domain-containing protein n=2 Tax=Adineta steineri TaxID=433720 RepID=A0A813N0H0_9BILA|nr:unnamed protein product [Adineta steineri]
MSTFSASKAEEFRHVFDLFDKNGDGNIDANEIGQVMRSLGLNPTNKEIADLIAEVDKNGNQRLDFSEFCAFMSKHWHERDQEAELRDAFRLFDRDNSGLNPTNKEIADLIAEVDKNGNQRLDFSEFCAFMSKHWHERDQEAELRDAFRLFDRDNSGYITINELKQVMLNMGEKLNQEELEDMMREADVNRDGKLDYQEFVQKLLSTS